MRTPIADFDPDPDHGLDLVEVLGSADVDDLVVLFDYITDKGKGRLSMFSNIRMMLTNAKSTRQDSEAPSALIADELRRLDGNTMVNLALGGARVRYKEILCDVASRVNADFNPKSDCAHIEVAIIDAVLAHAIAELSEQEKAELFAEFGGIYETNAGPAVVVALKAAIKASGFGSDKAAAIAGNAFAEKHCGRGLNFDAFHYAARRTAGPRAPLMRGISVFSGPIGWVITGIWTTVVDGSLADRVTAPVLIQIALKRQKVHVN